MINHDTETWNIGEPGGPSGSAYSIVTDTGRVVALYVPEHHDARYIVACHAERRQRRTTISDRQTMIEQITAAIDKVTAGIGDDAVLAHLRGMRLRLRLEAGLDGGAALAGAGRSA